MKWLGFWIFMSTLLICDTYLYSKGHEGIFWSHKTAEEKQIQQACDYYKKRRDVLKKLADELESGRRYWQVHFGLEEVL